MLLSAVTMEPAVLAGLCWVKAESRSLGRLPAASPARARATGPSRGRAGNQAPGSSFKGDTDQANRNPVGSCRLLSAPVGSCRLLPAPVGCATESVTWAKPTEMW